MSEANTLKAALSSKKSSTSSKGPAYYAAEAKACIAELAADENEEMRLKVILNPHTPLSILKERLKVETDIEILREILMSDRTPRKAVLEFFTERPDEICGQFEGDQEMINKFRQ